MFLDQHARQGRHDKDVHQSARAAEEDLHQGEGRPGLCFWGLYVHVCKEETLREAYRLVRANRGAPGIDGATFEAIEAGGLEVFLEQLRGELISGTYRPMRNRQKAIPKGDGRDPDPGNPDDSGPRRPGCVEAHPGADL